MNGSEMMRMMKRHINERADGTRTLERVELQPEQVKPLEGDFIEKKENLTLIVLDSFSDFSNTDIEHGPSKPDKRITKRKDW